MSTIETHRLLLRQHSSHDMAEYAAFWAAETPEIAGVPINPSLNQEEIWARLLRFVGHWAAFGFGPFLAIDRATDAVVGEVGFAYFHRGHGADFDASPEAMWKIDHRCQGSGVATEATQAAARWFDGEGFATRTVCMIHPHNTASLRIAGRLGFHQFADAIYHGNPVLLLERVAT